MAGLFGFMDLIKRRVLIERKTFKEVSEELLGMFPDRRGFSARSIRRFCSENDFLGTSGRLLTDPELDVLMASSIAKVCSLIKIIIRNVNILKNVAAINDVTGSFVFFFLFYFFCFFVFVFLIHLFR